MLAPLVAEGIKEQVRHYLEATFEFRDKKVRRAFSDFINHPENGLFLGTWIQLKRPFKVDEKADISELLDLSIPFRPYVHQVEAWRNLSQKVNQKPKHAVVTTGTGSGKTECFLYPILDYCLRQARAGRQGIKAIVLYPMNALASDQEHRFAEEIWNNKDLKAAGIRVGIYTGENDRGKGRDNSQSGHKEMGETHAISHRDTLIHTPPDVLLTNYKMLDLMLMRTKERGIWQQNMDEDNPLQYIVLDELHTYEGAQGADVGCLIRRLKARLNIPRGKLSFVGTSATLEEAPEETAGESDKISTPRDLLAQFAGKIFEESIDPNEHIIGESRKEIRETLRRNPELETGTRGIEQEGSYLPEDGEELDSYIKRQIALWGIDISEEEKGRAKSLLEKQASDKEPEEVVLAEYLKKEPRLRSLLELCKEAEASKKVLTTEEFANKLFPLGEAREKKAMFLSFLSLIAVAKEVRGGRAKPFLSMQAQVWLRQLGRVGRKLSTPALAEFCWLDSPPNDGAFLPTFHCGECHASGWVAFRREETKSRYANKGWKLNSNYKEIYEAYFADNRNIALVCPKSEIHGALDVPQQMEMGSEEEYFLFPRSLVLKRGEQAPEDGDEGIPAVFSQREGKDRATGRANVRHSCPCCGKSRVLFFVGVEPAVLASVAIDSLYNSSLNKDPKLLAFNDSVQDASYHAGFYSSRTYSFTFRTALQQVIESKGEQGLRVVDAGKDLVDYWAAELFSGDKSKAVEALIPKDLLDVPRVYSYIKEDKRSLTDALREKIELRLHWEAISSFGARAKFGRTLERVSASYLHLPREIFENTAKELKQRVADELPALARLTEEELLGWLIGLNHYYRQEGCLYHPYVDSLVEVTKWGRYKEKSRTWWQPRDSRFGPKFLSRNSISGRQYIIPFSKGKAHGRSWYFDWCRRSLNTQISVDDLVDLGALLLRAGESAGLYRRFTIRDEPCFIIDTEKATFRASPVKLSTGELQTEVNVASEAAEVWRRLPSLGMYRTKLYMEAPLSELDQYYRSRFSKGIPRKVIAREHTGLLKKTDRENLENRFKAQGEERRGDDPNLLTCTSTLEMGINIGDLSSTLLCSIPPTTSNYLQRVGRAGRLTGSSLIFAIVNQRPHDTFFVSRPVEMLKGEVKAPNCWLDASAVLTRQFVAYTLDSATKEGVYGNFPESAKLLESDYQKDHSKSQSRKWLAWIGSEFEPLLENFRIRFAQDSGVSADTWKRFEAEVRPREIAGRVGEVIRNYSQEERALRNSIGRLEDRLKTVDPHDEDTKREIRAELSQLKNQKQSSSIQDAIGLLCNHGILPNYAFPEKGVRFYGQAFRDSDNKDEKIQHLNVDTVRPASAAIRELAPHNTFYSHGCCFPVRVIPIAYSGGRDTQEETNADRIELFAEWRMCPNCGFSKKIKTDEERSACPQCDSPRFRDVQREKTVVDFASTQAKSFVDINRAAVEDSRESRESNYYHVVTTIDTSTVESSQAVGSENTAFGIEFFPSAQLYQFNGGYRSQTPDFQMGRENAGGRASALNSLGFRFCLDCGAVGADDASVSHLSNCKKRYDNQKNRQFGEEEDESKYNYKQAFLGRELTSEAIRLLLPYSDRVSVNTFAACLNLGLKLKHQGKPGEVRVEYQAIPQGDGEEAPVRRYLLLMDTVPGGTGFLKSLFDSSEQTGNKGAGVVEILQLALNVLKTCPCGRKDAGEAATDGCYRCIRTYHQQYQAEYISRDKGIEVLEEFILAAKEFAKVDGLESLGNARIFDSELEQRFIERFSRFCETVSGDFEETIVRGKQGFRFSLPGSEISWEIEMHSPLGKDQGVQQACEADFMFIPNSSSVKPIAVFTDGFEYHAKALSTLREDIRKRRAVLDSGNFVLWQLGWKDVCNDYNPADVPQMTWCDAEIDKKTAKIFRQKSHESGRDYKVINFSGNSFQLLLEFVKQPNLGEWKKYAEEFAKLQIFKALVEDFPLFFKTQENLSKAYSKWLDCSGHMNADSEGSLLCSFSLTPAQDILLISSEELIECPVIYSRFKMETREGFNTEPGFEYRWLGFWRILNQYQFLGRVNLFGSHESIEGYGYWELPDFKKEDPLAQEWQGILGTVLVKARPKLESFARIADEKFLPEVEYEPEFGTESFAELAWPTEKVCVLAGEQEDFSSKWTANGWLVVKLVDWMGSEASEFLSLLKERS